MLKSIRLTNFRKFSSFYLRVGPGNVLVGPNNAGKSSILDSIRILDACVRYSRSKKPELIDLPGRGVFSGYEIPEEYLPCPLTNITLDYSENDAVLEFEHTNGAKNVVLLHPDRVVRYYLDASQALPRDVRKFRDAFPISFVIVPTLAPLEIDERYVQDQTVQRNAATRLASRVFRNIWYRRTVEEFSSFKADVEAAWPGIAIQKPERRGVEPELRMFYTENKNDREVQWAGFGFQVWLQILTHLRRGDSNAVLVIDEPDVYLHPDLQRRLLRLIKSRFRQYFIATHAIEIIDEAERIEITSISNQYRSGKRISSEKEFDELYRHLGSTSNADFARIARARRVLFVEGLDGGLLRRFGRKLGFGNLAEPQNTPIIKLGGFSEWRKALNSVWALKEILDLNVASVCVFDRDYRCADEIAQFKLEVEKSKVECHVLPRKEIENFLLDPNAIYKALFGRGVGDRSDLTLNDVTQLLSDVLQEFRTTTFSQILARELEYKRKTNPGLDFSSVTISVTPRFERDWSQPALQYEMAPGKAVLGKLNERLQELGFRALTSAMIIDRLDVNDLDPSWCSLLKSLDNFCRND
ncbi:ATP-dependent endonuclease [Roseomonas sp. CCTCC AB2023176]|uniref:ATP-dependent nuclease n=1 Tax=Roseomonas sp. CCTCC AB2023176 TaxID=3342640 RepID=UPI0035D5BCF4